MSNQSAYIDEWCTVTLLKIGIPINLIGFRYLKSAIEKAYFEQSLMNSYTKKLYPSVASEFCVQIPVIERGIRNAIEVAINRKNSIGINELFGFEVFDFSYKPSNSELIGLLVEKLHMEMRNKTF